MVPVLIEQFLMSAQSYSDIIFAFMLAYTIVNRVSGRRLDRWEAESSTVGASIGAILAPPLLAWIVLSTGWREVFVLVGLLGFVWLSIWLLFYRELQAVLEKNGSDMIFSLLTGWLLDRYSFHPVFVLFGIFPIISAWIVWKLPEKAVSFSAS
jgi:MFS family permease